MTEADWLGCADPTRMVDFLTRRRTRGRSRERRLTLFACACCRRLGRLIPTEPCRRAIEVAERYADGLATEQERFAAWSAAVASAEEEGIPLRNDYYAETIEWGCVPGGLAALATVCLVGAGEVDARGVATHAASEVALDAGQVRSGKDASEVASGEAFAAEAAAQCLLLREIFHNPFRPSALDPARAAWRAGAARAIAQGIYEDRAFAQLPILADALQEAGCADSTILDHLRGPGSHVRGCWALDLVLGKV
jgi:hypothetical protein